MNVFLTWKMRLPMCGRHRHSPGHLTGPQWLSVPLAGFSLGLLNLTRPLTGIAVGIPFFIYELILLIKGKTDTRWRILATGAIIMAISVWFFAWSNGPVRDAALAQHFPGRRILNYYPANGRKLLASPSK
jgi:4-amino-4-deoxy-L-arabinose transferase-like glycosyltransferase